MLTDGERITAVLDWSGAMYGDFLYDVAWLVFGLHKQDLMGLLHHHYRSERRTLPYFEERAACYQTLVGLTTTAFFAKLGQGHETMRDRLCDRTLALTR